MRGIPGCGKSTASKMLGTKAICSSDDYLYTRDGKYIWSPERVRAAHKWCQRKCLKYMGINADRIVIDNTNTSEKEFKPYEDMAKVFGYKIIYFIVENRHNGVNIHNVPLDVISNMKKRLLQSIKL